MSPFALVLATFTALSPQQDPFAPKGFPVKETTIALSIRPQNRLSLVEAMVDGVKATLLFDTGASHTTFDSAFVEQRLPAKKPEPIAIVGNTNVKTAPKSFHLGELKIGEAVFADFEVMSVPLGSLSASVGCRVDGILGMNVINACPALVSVSGAKVVFNPLSTPKAVASTTALMPTVPRLAVKLGGKEEMILVDTGSSFTFLKNGLWPLTTNSVAMSATGVNGTEAIRPLRGVKGTIDLGGSVEIEPMVMQRTGNILGADTLERYDLFLNGSQVSFSHAPSGVHQCSPDSSKE